jgi:hypothetical protein
VIVQAVRGMAQCILSHGECSVSRTVQAIWGWLLQDDETPHERAWMLCRDSDTKVSEGSTECCASDDMKISEGFGRMLCP